MDQFDLLLRSPANLAILDVPTSSCRRWRSAMSALMDRLLFDVGRIRRNNEWYRWVSSAFIHGDPFHLFMNMLALFFFGPMIEYSFGPLGFLGIYFGSLIGGSAWTWMEHFRDANYKALGASGAISGVTSAIALFAPFSTIYAFFAIPMPLIVFALARIIVWSAVASSTGRRDGIGHAAHLGGALTGIAIVCIFWPEAPQAMIDQLWDRIRGL